MEDILAALTMLDKKGIKVCCVADNVKLLPKFAPEELDLSSVMKRLLILENKVADHEERLEQGTVMEVNYKGDIEQTLKKVQSVESEMKDCKKIVNDTHKEVITHTEERRVSMQNIILDEKKNHVHT